VAVVHAWGTPLPFHGGMKTILFFFGILEIFFFKGRNKRLAAPIYIRLERKEMDNTKPKQLRGKRIRKKK
jgi:hypothetical protein